MPPYNFFNINSPFFGPLQSDFSTTWANLQTNPLYFLLGTLYGTGTGGSGETDNKTSFWNTDNGKLLQKTGSTILNSGLTYFNSKLNNVESPELFNMATSIKTGNPYVDLSLQGTRLVDKSISTSPKDFNVDLELKSNTGASYGGAFNTMDKAEAETHKRYGLLSTISGEARKAKNLGKYGNLLLIGILKVYNDNLALQQRAQDPTSEFKYLAMMFGNNPSYALSAKYGAILKRINNKPITTIRIEDDIIDECEEEPIEITMFQKGGSFNIIPEGALHARKHNIDLDNITKKGIPVVSESEGGEILQQAEIEHSEIIFRLEVTEKIEELMKLYKDGKEDAAIEAGKLITEEILNNTQDRVGLIDSI